MGSLASRPKVPNVQQPQIVYIPAPVQSSPASTPLSTNPSVEETSTSENVAEQREKNLLTRNRGRFGTVTTSFRGLLNTNSANRQTKTLLGE